MTEDAPVVGDPKGSPTPVFTPQLPAGTSSGRLTILRHVEDAILAVLVVATAIIVLAQVFTRYVINQPLTWSGEVATDLLVWISLVGMAVALRERAHVAMSVLSERFPKQLERVTVLAQLLLVAAFLVLLFIGSIEFIQSQWGETSPAQIPVWVPYASLPFGAALGLIHVAAQLWSAVGSLRGSHVEARG